jgi:hypothetical protein
VGHVAWPGEARKFYNNLVAESEKEETIWEISVMHFRLVLK